MSDPPPSSNQLILRPGISRNVLDASPGALVALDEKARVAYANPAASELAGTVRGSFFGRSIEGFFPGENREIFFAKLQQFFGDPRGAATRPAFEISILRQDGSELPVEVRLGALWEEERLYALAAITDVSARIQFAQELAERERLVRTILDNSPHFIGLLDSEGRMMRPNQRALEFIGVEIGAVRGRYFWETPWWKGLEEEAAALRDYVHRAATGETVAFETVNRRNDGEVFNIAATLSPAFDESGEIVGLVAVGWDVTDRVQAKEALKRSEEQFAVAFNSSPEAMSIADLATGCNIEVNAAYERLVGCRREDLIGRRTDALGAVDDGTGSDAFRLSLASSGRVVDREIEGRNGAGKPLHLLVSAELIHLGGRACYLRVIRDVTAQREAEDRRRELERQLREAQRMETLGTLASGIAHDFNNILTAILAYTELAELDAANGEALRRHLRQVRTGGERARDLVRRILAVARQRPQERRSTQLATVVREVEALLRSTLPSTIRLETSEAPDTPAIHADPVQMHQILMNLCTNSAQSLEGRRGVLRISLAPHRAEAGEIPAGTYACLRVEDDGPGMPPEVLQNAFEPFFSTKPSGQGTGLGLAVVKGIVTDHEGFIFVRSTPGEGTQFRLYFPEDTAGEEGSETPAEKIPPGNGERVVVIDDESTIGESVGLLLRHLGYDVVVMTDADVYRDEAGDTFQHADLVLSDLTMPGLTGLEVARRVRRHRPECPVLIATGHLGPLSEAELRAAGVVEVLLKPLALPSLARAIRMQIDASRRS